MPRSMPVLLAVAAAVATFSSCADVLGIGDLPQPPQDGAVGSEDAALPPGCDRNADPATTPCVVADAIARFVSIIGSDSNPGTKASPFRSIGQALKATKSSGRSRVYVCAGDYPESVTIDSSFEGIQIHGGFDCNGFVRNGMRPRIFPADPSVALRIDGVSTPLLISDLDIQARDATSAGGSSIGLVVLRAGDVFLRRMRITAGRGSTGGPVGAPPSNASSQSLQGNNAGSVTSPGAAKTCTCPNGTSSVGGGGGGPSSAGASGSATPANHAAGGGLGGTPIDTCRDGQNGSPGFAGAAGAAAATRGTVDAIGWLATTGGVGANGNPGQGGGGGSGSGPSSGGDGSGSSGGCGSCGGAGGLGGAGGGSSIAVFAADSAIVIEDSELLSSEGGSGGIGGIGENGRNGGGSNSASTRGCFGGSGGAGASGSGGGGGTGGLSVGLLHTRSKTTPRVNGTPTDDTLTLTGIMLGAAGRGGAGGSPGTAAGGGNAGAVGGAGLSGLAQAIMKVP